MHLLVGVQKNTFSLLATQEGVEIHLENGDSKSSVLVNRRENNVGGKLGGHKT